LRFPAFICVTDKRAFFRKLNQTHAIVSRCRPDYAKGVSMERRFWCHVCS
jgi:hypothetical protein